MTQDQARAHLEGMRNMLRGEAEGFRKAADDYRRAANECDEPSLREVQFDNSSKFAAQARACDRDAEAMDIVLQERSHG